NSLNFDDIFNINEDEKETVDDNSKEISITEKAKTYYFSVNKYEN
ncbi:4122_t:CDS:2, partial [Scutellospora calospora]